MSFFTFNRLIILLFFSTVFLVEAMPGETALRTRTGIEYINAFNFRKADQLIKELDNDVQGEIYSSLLKLYKYYWRFQLSSYDDAAEKEFRNTIIELQSLCGSKDWLMNPDAVLFKICTYIFQAVLDYNNDNFLAAYYWLGRGFSDVDELEESDYNRGDLEYIRACREYYSLFSDEKVALEKFKNAAEDGFYFKDLAALSAAEILHNKMNNPEAAVIIYREMKNRCPGNTVINYYLAKSLQHAGLYCESIKVLEETISTICYRPEPLELLCEIHFSAGQIYEYNLIELPRAAAEYEEVLKYTDPEIEETAWYIPWSRLHLGGVFYKMHKPKEALRWLEAVEPDDDPDAYRKAGNMIKMLKNDR